MCLFYKKTFNERMGEVTPTIEAVLMASKEVSHSRWLRKMFEMSLAFGNYINKGSRGMLMVSLVRCRVFTSLLYLVSISVV